MFLLLLPEITVLVIETLTTKQILHKPKSISVVSQPRILLNNFRNAEIIYLDTNIGDDNNADEKNAIPRK